MTAEQKIIKNKVGGLLELVQHLGNVYKERNLVERFFLKLKAFRRIAMRYVKLMINYGSMQYLVAALNIYSGENKCQKQ